MKEKHHRQKKNKACVWLGKLNPCWVRLLSGAFKVIKYIFIGCVIGFLIWDHEDNPARAKFIGYLFGGALLYWQISSFSRRAAAAEKTAKLTEKGHIHERFKNAIEHLGKESTSVRLGGIYALHNLARDVNDYREQVFEILCAHIRETTTQKGYESRIAKHKKNRPTIEIQSILDILFGKSQDRQIYAGLEANLERSDLGGANLDYANLERANLRGAILKEASLSYANLKNAKVEYSNLYEATLFSANLFHCYFIGVNLQGADLNWVENLDVGQFSLAKTLYMASLPRDVGEVIARKHPELMEKPNDNQST